MLPRRLPVRPARRPSAYVARGAAVLLAIGGIPWAMADDGVTPQQPAVVAAEGRDSVPATPASPSPSPSPTATPTASTSTSARGTYEVLADAYTKAAKSVPASCNLRPSLIAGIGHVESGSIGGRTLTKNVVTPNVVGVILAGNGFAAIPDTDDGKLDGHTTWDRAVGPLQFIPGTWRLFGQDGDGDGHKDPQNVYDAAFATAAYLCSNSKNLADPSHRTQAILEYNESQEYLDNVLSWRSTSRPTASAR